MLLQDASISTDLVVRPGQDVSVSGDRSLAQPPLWGSGGFTVQQRGLLDLKFVIITGDVSVNGGELSLAQVSLAVGTLAQGLLTATAGGVMRLSEVTVLGSWQDMGVLTGSAAVGADGVPVYDPPNSLPAVTVCKSLPNPIIFALSPTLQYM